MGTILIVGAGRLGIAVAARRQSAGERVLALRRSPQDMPEGVELVLSDVTRPDAFACIGEPVHRVVYCVGPDSRTPEDYERSFVIGLLNLLKWLRTTGQAPRLLFVSSTAVYAQVEGEWVNEESETAPTSPNSRLLLDAEQLVRAYGGEGLVLRLAGLYGPNSPSLLERVRRGLAPQSPGTRYVNRIHLTDAAAAVEHLLLLEAPAPVYIGVDDAPASEEAILVWLLEQFNLPLPVFSNRPAQAVQPNKRCSNARLKQTGFSLQFPTFREGYLQLARDAGLLPKGR